MGICNALVKVTCGGDRKADLFQETAKGAKLQKDIISGAKQRDGKEVIDQFDFEEFWVGGGP